MRDRVAEAMGKVKSNGWIDVLKECPEPKGRYDKLLELLPEIRGWPRVVANLLVFYIDLIYDIDFGVCEYYFIDDHRQYCQITGIKQDCNCTIPHPPCVFREQDVQPAYS